MSSESDDDYSNTNTNMTSYSYTKDSYTKDSSRCDTDKSDYTESCDRRKNRRRRHRSDSDCSDECDSSYDCGIKNAQTPIGVWNLVYSCDDSCTTTGTMNWVNQLLLNGDKTLNNFVVPDLTNNPLPYIVTPGAGVWEIVNERKYKLHITHIGYRSSDGCPQVYYKLKITCKLNSRGNKLRFQGEARSYDMCDPSMCTPTDQEPLCFYGHGVKVLEPQC